MRPLTILIPVALLALTACGTSQDPSEDTASQEVAALSDATVEVLDEADMPEPATPDVDADEALASTVATETEPEVPAAVFTLRRGETLAHFARWSDLPVETIAATSELDLDGIYPVGTEVRVPVSDEALDGMIRRREAHQQARVDGYLASRGGSVGTEELMVRTGDSAWTLARREAGIPVWLLEAYNPDVDLDRLRPGQTLSVPVIADIVADVGATPEPEVDLLADESIEVPADVPPEPEVHPEPAIDLLIEE